MSGWKRKEISLEDKTAKWSRWRDGEVILPQAFLYSFHAPEKYKENVELFVIFQTCTMLDRL